MAEPGLPRLAAPAARALRAAGVRTLGDLTRWRRADLARLHGMGPKALRTLDAALTAAGLSFADSA